jgi:hypothetical protein
MYSRVAVTNNYATSLYPAPIRKGLRNLIEAPDNIGNIVFLNAISTQIKNCTSIHIQKDLCSRPKWFMDNFDVLVLPMANMVSSYCSFDNLVDVLEKYPIPIVLLSIGVQAINETELQNMTPSEPVVRLLNLARSRSQTIGVRGAITSEYLTRLGYLVDTIGCPSVFEAQGIVSKKSLVNRVATHCTPRCAWPEAVKNLFAFSWKYAQGYVAQSELQFLIDKYDIPDPRLKEWIRDKARLEQATNRSLEYSYFAATDPSPEELQKWLKRNLTFFTDLPTWKEYLATFDLIVGSRFHGGVMGTLAGAPSLILSSDLRTRELVEYHQLPYMPLANFTRGMTPEFLMERIDYRRFQRDLPRQRQAYKLFLIKNGLEPTNYT